MRWTHGDKRASLLSFVAASSLSFVGLGGCIEYTIETTLEADGSGARSEEMAVNRSAGPDDGGGLEDRVTEAEFAQLMGVGRGERWERSSHVEDDDTVYVLQRETRVRDLTSWSALSGDVDIRAATRAGAESRVGRIRLGDVHFQNSLQVESGSVTEGVSYTFRESFYWENILDALIEWYARYVENTIASQYPNLSAEERGEIVGLVKGGFWSVIDRGLLDTSGDEEAQLMAAFIERTSEQSMMIIRRRNPSADVATFSNMLRQIYEDEEDNLGTFISKNMPGVELAANTEIIFRLNMPGRIIETNAHDRDGTTLIWKFGPGDAITAPIEIFARSVVEQ